jgi:hypothetical protein
MKASAVGVGSLEVLGKLAAVGFNIGLVFRCLATLDLFFAFGFCNELVKFFLALGGVDVDATEASWVACGEECHCGGVKSEREKSERVKSERVKSEK